MHSLDSLIRLCFATELSAMDRYLMLGYNLSVPPYVREAMFARSFDNDDLLPRLEIPVLITQGDKDAVVKSSVIDQQMARIAHARVRPIENAGHACFWDEAPAYNRCLREFSEAM